MTTLRVDNQEITLFDNLNINDYTSIGVSLSGGTDSAMVLYLICTYASHLKIIPYTGIEFKHKTARPNNIWHAEEIVLLMRELFPAIDIDNIHTAKFNPKDLFLLAEAEKINTPGISKWGVVKRLAMNRQREILVDQGLFNLSAHGLTVNPPREDVEKFNILKVEDRRYEKTKELTFKKTLAGNEHTVYAMLGGVNKKFVAGLYKKFNLMDNLYPLTSSCVGTASATKYFTEPCRKCFWCHEKLWAFGTYDGGIV